MSTARQLVDYVNKQLLRRRGFELHRTHKSEVFLSNRLAMRFLYFARRFDEISHLSGDVVECGVASGRGLLMLAYLIKSENKGRQLWGFDTFCGLPKPGEFDTGSRDVEGRLAWSEDDVRSMLVRSDVGERFIDSHIHLMRGLVEDTLPSYQGKKIALLHLDLDLYSGYKASLENLFKFVVPGGIIMFDEYHGKRDLEKWPGAKAAVDEFFKENTRKIKYDRAADKYFFTKI